MASDAENPRSIKVKSPVMAKNDEIAASSRLRLDQLGILGVNIMSSPGSGKTTLLETMAQRLKEAMVVIEGDVQTRRDAERIERAGCAAYQIETRGACHLDAKAVAEAMEHLPLVSGKQRLLIIENVGNLICPSGYDLGERLRVGLLSVPEGDDKVLKYPSLFSRISVLVTTKIDLLPYLTFDVGRVEQECRELSAGIRTFRLSAKTGEGVDAFCDFLLSEADRARSAAKTTRSSVAEGWLPST
jgi:hydrogenase nickel incorporation protein HypB